MFGHFNFRIFGSIVAVWLLESCYESCYEFQAHLQGLLSHSQLIISHSTSRSPRSRRSMRDFGELDQSEIFKKTEQSSETLNQSFGPGLCAI